jgi:hypothetical protein
MPFFPSLDYNRGADHLSGCGYVDQEGFSRSGGLKGKCALGPFLSILLIKCQHKWFKCETMPNGG